MEGKGNQLLALDEKFLLTMKEASAYFGIGIKRFRRIAENNEGKFTFFIGNRCMIHRQRFESYLERVMDGEINPTEFEGMEEKE